MAYFSLQGRVYLAERSPQGMPLDLRYVGNVPALKVAFDIQKTEHKESTSGQRLTDFELITGKSGELDGELEDFNQGNLNLMLHAVSTAVAAGTVTGESLGVGMVAGSLRLLQNQFVSEVEVVDSTPTTPKTLPTGQYKVHGQQGGIELLDLTAGGPYVQPFLVDYDYGAAVRAAMFKAAQPQLWLRFDGINTADNNRRVVIDLYRVSFNPTKELGLITEALGALPLTGRILADTDKDADGEMGQFGRIIQLTV